MGRIPEDVVARVRAAHDIVDVVGRSLPLQKRGSGYLALCPFHEEKTPSFHVNPRLQTFKCFGCGKGGNVFQWLMEREGLRFFEAVRALAAEKGIEVPAAGGREGPDASRIEGIRAALALAQDLYVRTLWGPEGLEARAYLAKRGFAEPAARAFGLGLSPLGWDGLLSLARSKGLSPEVLEDAGLAIRREGKTGFYDRFRGRLMFPVADVSGRIATYGARALRPDDQPKYLNGPETPVFRKGGTLYALDRAKDAMRKTGTAVLMEGYTDVLMAHVHGFTSAVAGMGTAFTHEQARTLKHHARRVVLLYDGDAAGRAAAEKSIDVLLEAGVPEIRVALLPEGRDVDEVLLEEGDARLKEILDAAAEWFEFLWAQLAARTDLSGPSGKAAVAARLSESIARVQDAIEQDLRFRAVAERLKIPEHLVRGRAATAAAEQARRQRPPGPGRGPTGGGGAPVLPGSGSTGGPGAPGGAPASDPLARLRDRDLRLEQERLVAAALFRPEYLRPVREALPAEEIQDGGLAALYGVLLEMGDRGLVPTAEAVAERVAPDPEASRALAGLPADPPSDDWVEEALRHRRGRRAATDRRRSVLQRLAQPPDSPQDPSPGAPGADAR